MLLVEPLTVEDGSSKRTKLKYPYSIIESTHTIHEKVSTSEKLLDSGIETSDLKSVISSKQIRSLTGSEKQVKASNSLTLSYCTIVPVEILLTAGKIALGLYEVDGTKPVVVKQKNKKKKLQKILDDDELGYEAEEENADNNDG